MLNVANISSKESLFILFLVCFIFDYNNAFAILLLYL